ncbi:MAG: DUF3737 family protein [Anaeroplasmataceae bacterium]
MRIVKEQVLTGERAAYNTHDTKFYDVTFADGESPLKECSNIELYDSIFKWKYPLWYSKDIYVNNTTWLDTARSGVWYTNNLVIENSLICAPKQFRRCNNITLKNVQMPNAIETLWTCENVKLSNVVIKGDYFGMNSKNVYAKDFIISGNYTFDGASNVEIHNAKMDSRDSFWNCDNVVVYDSLIIGEYIGWNSKNVTFINCTIDSNQGMCYMKNIKMVNCKLLNTDLCFEFCSDVDAEIVSDIDSVKNPYNGKISAKRIKEIILDNNLIDPNKVVIKVEE